MLRRKANDGGRFQNRPERSQRVLPKPWLGSKALGDRLLWSHSAKTGGQAGSALRNRGGHTGVTRGLQVGAGSLGAGAGRACLHSDKVRCTAEAARLRQAGAGGS